MKEQVMQTDMKEQLLQTVKKSEQYTLQVVEAMTENGFGFKPAGAGWDFAELMSHVAYGIEWWTENFVNGNEVGWAPKPVQKNKELLMKWIKKAYASFRASFEGDELDEKKIMGVLATLDHITHHRGQAVLYLRCLGINPPEYVY